MKPKTSIAASLAAACLLACGSVLQAQTISNVYPDGTHMFEPSTTLAFTASSSVAVTNVTVGLTVTSLQTGQSFLKNLSLANGLTVSGPANALNVSAVLTTDILYSASIQIKDANGNTASQTVSFDTIVPAYQWEAEDWDFTSNSIAGLFINNPQTNAYAGLGTTDGLDAHNNNGTAAYRPVGTSGSPGGLATETISSPETSYERVQYLGAGNTNKDYDVGYTDGGDFGNYTRNYPAGSYNIFVRASGGNGAHTESADISVVSGTATLASAPTSTGAAPFKYGVLGRGWQSFDFCPVTDSAGKLAVFTSDGSVSTLQVLQNQASDNINFFMLVPLNTNVVASTATITNVYPDGAYQFEATNQLTFTAFSSVAINPAFDVTVQLTGTNLVTGMGSVTLLTSANGLTITGGSTNIVVSAPLASNSVYTAYIQVSDANGVPASFTVKFDTIDINNTNSVYTFEAEDFNFGGGGFIDNPQTNAYADPAVSGVYNGINQVDYNYPSGGGAVPAPYYRIGLKGEGTGDVPRIHHLGLQDFDLGNTEGGEWGNYSRHFPKGVWNIFIRTATGSGNSVTDAGNVALVTGDPTQPNQTLQPLGKYNTPNTGGWQTYAWAPVINSGGTRARFVSDGVSEYTLRHTFDSANENVNFFMLLPADLSVNPPPYIGAFTPDNSVLFQSTNALAFTVNSSVGIATSNIVVNLNGVNVTGLSFSGSSTFWNVTYPVKTNALYTAIITLTDAAGTTSSTNVFNTFSAGNYQWEAEDYDYSGGSFYDNPQVGSYAGLPGTSGIDMLESDPNGPSRGNSYRPANGADFPDTSSGDQARAQFTAAGQTDYSVGSFGPGSWANYTRTYPAGTYYVIGRFAEGAALSGATLSLVTSGVGSPTQTLSPLGVFNVPSMGWSTWEWSPLVDTNGNQVKITLTGQQTLQLGGSTANGAPEVNVNFFMLVATPPTPVLTASVSGGIITISFPTQSNYSYQLLYKNNLTDASWTPLGASVSGNGSVQSVTDSATGSGRYYRVSVQ